MLYWEYYLQFLVVYIVLFGNYIICDKLSSPGKVRVERALVYPNRTVVQVSVMIYCLKFYLVEMFLTRNINTITINKPITIIILIFKYSGFINALAKFLLTFVNCYYYDYVSVTVG